MKTRKWVRNSTLLEDLRAGTEFFGRPPTVSEMNSYGYHSSETYKKRFGTWDAALVAAGVAKEDILSSHEQDLLEELRAGTEVLGRPPKNRK